MEAQSFAPVKLIASRASNVNRYTADDSLERKENELIPPYRGFVSRVALSLFGKISRVLYCLKIEGLENIPDKATFIFCPNHESHIDVFWVIAHLPKAIRDPLCAFAKKELLAAPHTLPIGGGFNLLHCILAKAACVIPIDRDGFNRGALRAGFQALESGRSLLIHPEGTRTRTGEILPFNRGAASIAKKAGVPLVPVRIIGPYAIWPAQRTFPRLFDWRNLRRFKVTVIFGPPIYPNSDSSSQQLTEQLQEVVSSLAD